MNHEGEQYPGQELEERRRFMDSHGYRLCDIPACNCGSWHGGHAEERLREIRDLLGHERTNGKTLLAAVEELIKSDGMLQEYMERYDDPA